jgi:hypothetical protein
MTKSTLARADRSDENLYFYCDRAFELASGSDKIIRFYEPLCIKRCINQGEVDELFSYERFATIPTLPPHEYSIINYSIHRN